MSGERPNSSRASRRADTRDGRDPLWALLRASRAITSSHNLVQSVGTVKGAIVDLFDGSGCRVDVHLLQEDGTFVSVLPDAGDSPGEAPEVLERSSPDKVVREAFDARSPVQSEFRAAGRARVVLPVVFKGRALGCIDVSRDHGQGFSDDEVELLQVLTNQAAAAVENARLARTLERQADNDSLTGLHTRRFFYDRLMSEATRVRRYQGDLCVVLLDLDDFGTFNKAHGRRAGDRVLRGVGRLVQCCVRRWVDVASRLDGQQFGLLLPQTSARDTGVQVVTERVRKAIDEAVFRDEGDELVGTITASLGVAGLPADAEDPDDLLHAAHEALKAAKAAGKNRVVMYRDTC